MLLAQWRGFLTRSRVDFAAYLGAHYDASTTNLTYRVETNTGTPLELTVSFLSPITPTSTLRQAIPASYVTVYVQGNVDVNVYIDVNGGWVTGDSGSRLEWHHESLRLQDGKSSFQSWRVRRQNELLLSEIRDRAEWGTLHLSGPAVRTLFTSRLQTSTLAFFADDRCRMPATSLERHLL